MELKFRCLHCGITVVDEYEYCEGCIKSLALCNIMQEHQNRLEWCLDDLEEKDKED